MHSGFVSSGTLCSLSTLTPAFERETPQPCLSTKVTLERSTVSTSVYQPTNPCRETYQHCLSTRRLTPSPTTRTNEVRFVIPSNDFNSTRSRPMPTIVRSPKASRTTKGVARKRDHKASSSRLGGFPVVSEL